MISSPILPNPNRYNVIENVPYDVWRHITSFLPPAEVKQLYTLNHSLLSIAMDERYKTANFGFLFQKQTMKTLARLVTGTYREPDIACRVRTFTCQPGHLCHLLQQERGKWAHKRMAENLLARFQSISSPTDRPEVDRIRGLKPKTIQKMVFNIMKNLTSLTSLNIDIQAEDHVPFSQATPSPFVEGWQAFGRNLTTLDLSVPLEDLHLVLPTGPTKLTNLRTLSVRILRAYSASDETVILPKTLLPFINGHKTITSLALEAPEGIKLFFLLQHLTSMPSLQTFRLEQSFESLVEADYLGLYQFLLTHQTRIRDLNIGITSRCRDYPYPSILSSQECFRVPLPVIERLSVNLSYSPSIYNTSFVSYFIQYKATLTSLTIKEQRLADGVLSLLVTDLASPGILRELEISIFSLKPSIFQHLAINLPSLEVLTLNFLYPSDTQKRISIPQWGLHTLNLHVHSSSLWPDRKADLLAILPNVQTFSGLSRAQYLTDENL
ncbi:hypothetical protein BYT27DRAFT_7292709 [Phlegmacium glaucopus]|nr:hypothetical protein BYT27DRAFT_7292709 [Phlegmacium glaucopus]